MCIVILPGQYYDEETGLHYNYHRYYDPKIGRYLKADPIGLAGKDPNLYGYVSNNPVNASDFYGLAGSVPAPTPFPIPLILPPSAIPGTPENEKLRDATLRGIDEIADAINDAADALKDTTKDECKDKEKDKKTCATHPEFQKYKNCKDIPWYYEYNSPTEALNYLKEITQIKNLKIVSKGTATGGPTPGLGKHWGVKGPGRPPYKASLMSCICCEDTPAGPVLRELWMSW